jgi:hypothetical protein
MSDAPETVVGTKLSAPVAAAPDPLVHAIVAELAASYATVSQAAPRPATNTNTNTNSGSACA